MANPFEIGVLRDQLAAIAARLNQVEIDLIVCCDEQQMLRQQVQDLHAREIYYRQLFETAKDGVAVLDANSGTILDVNPYLATIMGRSRLELRQTKFWDLSDASSAAQLQDHFAQLQQTNVIRFDDVSLANGNGRSIAVDVIANTFDDGRGKKVQCNIRTNRQQWTPETLT